MVPYIIYLTYRLLKTARNLPGSAVLNQRIYYLVILTGIVLSGCATVFSGTEQEMLFNSIPRGASVLIDGKEMGKTPLKLVLKRDKHEQVTFRKKGYQDKTLKLTTIIDPVAILNISWDFSTTDAISGALYEYEPGAYYVQLISNKKASNNTFERTSEQELVNFALMHYSGINRDCQIKCQGEQFETLSWYVSKAYNTDMETSRTRVNTAIGNSGDPGIFLEKLKESFSKAKTINLSSY